MRARVPNRFRPRLSDAASCSTSFRRLVWTSSNQSRRRSARAGVPCAVARLPEPFRGRAHRCSACSTSSPVLDQSRTSSWRKKNRHHPPGPTPLEKMSARTCPVDIRISGVCARCSGLPASVARSEASNMALEMADGKCIFFLSPKKALGEARTASRYDKRGRARWHRNPHPPARLFPREDDVFLGRSLHTNPAALLSSTTSRMRSSQPPGLR